MEVKARINSQRKTLVIEIPLQKATPSKHSGKTLVVATTHGCKTTEARHSGRQIVVTANAFVYPKVAAKTREQTEDPD
jgi:hypothetical protein